MPVFLTFDATDTAKNNDDDDGDGKTFCNKLSQKKNKNQHQPTID